MTEKGIVLLSGGLDSFVSLDIAKKNADIKLALIFNYGQKAFEEEAKAAIDIANYYKVEHKIIEIPFLKENVNCALVSEKNEELNDLNSVWIPNRNGLFINIGASFCESLNYKLIVFGANKEEGQQFPDNTKEFVDLCNSTFEYSTLNKVKVIAPCLQYDKIDMVNYTIDNSLPLSLIKSCYNSNKNTGKKHCGECLSCILLYNAIKKSKKPEILREVF